MGAALATEVFKPPIPAKYTDTKEGLQWLASGDADRRIPYIVYEGKAGEEPTWHVLYCKGGMEDIGLMDKWLRIMACTLHVNIWSFDYCGFGLSLPGIPSERHCFEDTITVFRYMTETKMIPPSRIIVYGRSLGSSPALRVGHLMTEKTSKPFLMSWRKSSAKFRSVSRIPVQDIVEHGTLGGIILQSPIFSVLSCAADVSKQSHRSFAPADMFENSKFCAAVTCPVLIVHGAKDDFVPPSQSEKLNRRLLTTKRLVVVEGAGHYDLEFDFSDELLDYISQFLRECDGKPPVEAEVIVHDKKPKPLEYDGPGIVDFLKRLEMLQYQKNFVSFGYMESIHLVGMTADELEAMGIQDPVHQAALLQAIANMNPSLPLSSYSPEDSLPSSEHQPVFGLKSSDGHNTSSSSVDLESSAEIRSCMQVAEESMRSSHRHLRSQMELQESVPPLDIGEAEKKKEFSFESPYAPPSPLPGPQYLHENMAVAEGGDTAEGDAEDSKKKPIPIFTTGPEKPREDSGEKSADKKRPSSKKKTRNLSGHGSDAVSNSLPPPSRSQKYGTLGSMKFKKRKGASRSFFRPTGAGIPDHLVISLDSLSLNVEQPKFYGSNGLGYGDMSFVKHLGSLSILHWPFGKVKTQQDYLKPVLRACQMEKCIHCLETLGVHYSDDSIGFLTEYADGTLDYMLKDSTLPLMGRMIALLQIAKGLLHLHRSDIVHGNLSTRTVCFTFVENASSLDFAAQWKSKQVVFKVSGYGLPICFRISGNGTPQRRTSDEKVWEGSDASVASDVWSFGALVFGVLAGVQETVEVAAMIAQKNFRLLPADSSKWEELILRCCDPVPSKRISLAKAEEMVFSLVQSHAKTESLYGKRSFASSPNVAGLYQPSLPQDAEVPSADLRSSGRRRSFTAVLDDYKFDAAAEKAPPSSLALWDSAIPSRNPSSEEVKGRSNTSSRGSRKATLTSYPTFSPMSGAQWTVHTITTDPPADAKATKGRNKKASSDYSMDSDDSDHSGGEAAPRIWSHSPLPLPQEDQTKRLSVDLLSLVNNEFMHDVVFLCGPTQAQFYAHRLILSSRSETLKEELKKLSANVDGKLVVHLSEPSPHVFLTFLRYVYGGVLPSSSSSSSSSNPSPRFSVNEFRSLRILAVRFGLVDLTSHCEAHL